MQKNTPIIGENAIQYIKTKEAGVKSGAYCYM